MVRSDFGENPYRRTDMVSKYGRHESQSVKNKLRIFTPAEGRIFGIWGLSDRFRCKIRALASNPFGSDEKGQFTMPFYIARAKNQASRPVIPNPPVKWSRTRGKGITEEHLPLDSCLPALRCSDDASYRKESDPSRSDLLSISGQIQKVGNQITSSEIDAGICYGIGLRGWKFHFLLPLHGRLCPLFSAIRSVWSEYTEYSHKVHNNNNWVKLPAIEIQKIQPVISWPDVTQPGSIFYNLWAF